VATRRPSPILGHARVGRDQCARHDIPARAGAGCDAAVPWRYDSARFLCVSALPKGIPVPKFTYSKYGWKDGRKALTFSNCNGTARGPPGHLRKQVAPVVVGEMFASEAKRLAGVRMLNTVGGCGSISRDVPPLLHEA